MKIDDRCNTLTHKFITSSSEKKECESMPRKPSIGILKARVLGFNEQNAATKSEAFLPSNKSADVRVKRSMDGALKAVGAHTHVQCMKGSLQ